MTRIRADDGIAYEVHDAGDGPPVLLIHGFTGTGAGWRDHLPELSTHHRVIAPDLLGHGGSDPAPAERHAIERQADDLADILRRLGAAPADVLGYSMGARVALWLAVRSPKRVGRLIVESPSAGIGDRIRREERRRADARWVDQLSRGDREGFVRDWAAQPIFASQGALPAHVWEALQRERLTHAPDGLASSLLGAGQGVMRPLHDRLGTIAAPTLVISGDLDRVGTAQAAEVAAAIPGASHVRIEGAGHTPHVERPERFRALVYIFLASDVVTSVSRT